MHQEQIEISCRANPADKLMLIAVLDGFIRVQSHVPCVVAPSEIIIAVLTLMPESEREAMAQRILGLLHPGPKAN